MSVVIACSRSSRGRGGRCRWSTAGAEGGTEGTTPALGGGGNRREGRLEFDVELDFEGGTVVEVGQLDRIVQLSEKTNKQTNKTTNKQTKQRTDDDNEGMDG